MHRSVRNLSKALVVLMLFTLTGCPKETPSTDTTAAATDTTATTAAVPTETGGDVALFQLVDEKGVALRAGATNVAALRISPGDQAEADAYYVAMRGALTSFPKTIPASNIEDMLEYLGYPVLKATDVEKLKPGILMNFALLSRFVSNKPEFAEAYRGNPIKPNEIVASRFFAPKIINVRDPQVAGVPVGGFGWRKLVRFRARDGSDARLKDGIDAFYLLFNFTTTDPKFPPDTAHAGQIQAILIPTYPHGGAHRDAWFLVYEGLGTANPGKVGFFLVATFDLAGVVPDNKYYVPRACAQCHGSVAADQKRAKVNYLDTDHWIDRTGDDFTKVSAADVLVDGVPQAYDAMRTLNTEILRQNNAVVDGGANFALLAAQKWLDLHATTSADANRHVPPLRRGFRNASTDAIWTDGATPDKDLLPMLNRYCFRCHSSVNYHVFEKQKVIGRKGSIVRRLDSTGSDRMPQDRVLDTATKDQLKAHVNLLP